jgi:hypothetical protein
VYEYYHYKNRSLTNHSDPTSKTKWQFMSNYNQI